jgi:cell division GTPase FtsZ
MGLFSGFFSRNEKRSALVIFIGDMGANVLNHMYKEQNGNTYFLAVNTDAAHLKNIVEINQEYKIFIGDKTEYSCGKRDFNSGSKYVNSNRKRLKSIIKKYPAKHIVLVAGLRYSSASGVIAGISQITKQSKANVTAIVSIPFKAEGQNAFLNSSNALTILAQNVDELIEFSCEDLMQQNGGKLLIKDLDKEFDRLVKNVI